MRVFIWEFIYELYHVYFFFVSPLWLRCIWVKVKFIALCGVLTQFFSCLFRLHKEAEGCAGGVSWRRSPFQIQSRAGVSAAQFPAPLFFLCFDLFLSLSDWYSDSFLHTLTKTESASLFRCLLSSSNSGYYESSKCLVSPKFRMIISVFKHSQNFITNFATWCQQISSQLYCSQTPVSVAFGGNIFISSSELWTALLYIS